MVTPPAMHKPVTCSHMCDAMHKTLERLLPTRTTLTAVRTAEHHCICVRLKNKAGLSPCALLIVRPKPPSTTVELSQQGFAMVAVEVVRSSRRSRRWCGSGEQQAEGMQQRAEVSSPVAFSQQWRAQTRVHEVLHDRKRLCAAGGHLRCHGLLLEPLHRPRQSFGDHHIALLALQVACSRPLQQTVPGLRNH